MISGKIAALTVLFLGDPDKVCMLAGIDPGLNNHINAVLDLNVLALAIGIEEAQLFHVINLF